MKNDMSAADPPTSRSSFPVAGVAAAACAACCAPPLVGLASAAGLATAALAVALGVAVLAVAGVVAALVAARRRAARRSLAPTRASTTSTQPVPLVARRRVEQSSAPAPEAGGSW